MSKRRKKRRNVCCANRRRHRRRRDNPRTARQRRLFGLALAVKRGHVSPRRVGADARRLARTVPEDVLREIARAESYHRNPVLQVIGLPARYAGNPFSLASLAASAGGGVGAGLGFHAVNALLKRNGRRRRR